MSAQYSTVITSSRKKTLILVLLSLFIVLPGITYLAFFGNSIFSQAFESAPRNVSISQITKSSATISWVSERSNQSVVQYGTSPSNLSSFSPEASSSKDHSVELTLLSPATTYYFSIQTGSKVHDNNGVPWTFTTKTLSGEEVKGISTVLDSLQSTNETTNSPSPTPFFCDTSLGCNSVRKQLGKGCTSQDYVKCLRTISVTPLPTLDPNILGTSTPTPSTSLESSVSIRSSLCEIDYLNPASCREWTWDSLAVNHHPGCQEEFMQYEVQCKSSSFDSNDSATWYLNTAITTIASNSAYLNGPGSLTPKTDQTVFCRVRAVGKSVDNGGYHISSDWITRNTLCD